MTRPSLTQETFKAKTKEDANGCWIWTSALTEGKGRTHKYGWVTFRGQQMGAHRTSWILFKGEIPAGLVICHKCDVPQCVNPDHLFLGTMQDNAQDMVAKGRGPQGVPRRKIDGMPIGAKLSLDQIQKIKTLRATGLSCQKIADNIGVSQTCIYKIVSGRTKYVQ